MATGTSSQASQSPISLTSQVFERLYEDVLFGRLPPGGKLKIEMLQQLYQCGATPVREALGLLCSTGMAERIDQRGFRVAPVSLDDYAELMRMRCFLEERALLDAMQHGGEDWEERIVLAQFHLAKLSARGNGGPSAAFKEWEDRHAEFHAALIQACPSKRLLAYCAQLYAESTRYRHIARRGSRAGSYEEHQRIAETVLRREPDAAVACLLDHYKRTAELLRETLASSVLNGADAGYGLAASA